MLDSNIEFVVCRKILIFCYFCRVYNFYQISLIEKIWKLVACEHKSWDCYNMNVILLTIQLPINCLELQVSVISTCWLWNNPKFILLSIQFFIWIAKPFYNKIRIIQNALNVWRWILLESGVWVEHIKSKQANNSKICVLIAISFKLLSLNGVCFFWIHSCTLKWL